MKKHGLIINNVVVKIKENERLCIMNKRDKKLMKYRIEMILMMILLVLLLKNYDIFPLWFKFISPIIIINFILHSIIKITWL